MITIYGAGKVGTALARAAIAGGEEVRVVGSGRPEELELLLSFIAPGAIASSAEDAAGSPIAIIAVPLAKHRAVDPEPLRGRIVVDAMNHWEPTDGRLPEFEAAADSPEGTSGLVAEHFAGARLVKTFNHLGYHDLDASGRAAAPGARLGLGVAGDDAEAVEAVAALAERLGFDPVTLPSLAAGRALEPGGPVFGANLPADEFRVRLEPMAALR